MESIGEIIGENIRKRRKLLGLSQSELGAKTGLSLQAINRIEAGKRQPRRLNLEAIAKALGCEVQSLYTGSVMTKFESKTPTVASLLQALTNLQDEVDKLRANPLVAYAETLTPSQAKAVVEILDVDVVEPRADKKRTPGHRK